MVATHVTTLRSLLEAALSDPAQGITIECKHFFSGAAAYADGRIFMTLTSVGLALKLPQESQVILIGQGAKPLRYFPNGPIKKDYVIVPERMARDTAALAPWVTKSILFARKFPKARQAKKLRGQSTR